MDEPKSTVPDGLSDSTLMFFAVASIDAMLEAFAAEGMDASAAVIMPSYNGHRTGPIRVTDIADAVRTRLGLEIKPSTTKH